MPIWKTLLVLVVIGAAYVLVRPYFPYVAVLAGLAWLVEYLRPKGEKPTSEVNTAARIARFLSVSRHPFQKAFKLRRADVQVHVAVTAVEAGRKEIHVVDVSTPIFREIPFCFVVRGHKAVVPESVLVENSRIPEIRFEYQLRRVDAPEGLEAAANMTDLFKTIIGTDTQFSPYAVFDLENIRVDRLFFNGRALHTHLVLGDKASPYELERLLHLHTGFHLTLAEIVENVTFKVPV